MSLFAPCGSEMLNRAEYKNEENFKIELEKIKRDDILCLVLRLLNKTAVLQRADLISNKAIQKTLKKKLKNDLQKRKIGSIL